MTNEQLWKAYKDQHSQKAKDELIVSYVSLVKIIAGRLYTSYNAHVEYDDLIGYGIIGLIDAIEKFDYKKDVKFETYANIRIRGSIIDQIRHLDWVPRSTRQKYKKVEEAISKLQKIHGGDVSDELVAKELELELEEYQKLLGEVTTYSILSLEEKIEENTSFDVAAEHIDFNPEANYIQDEMKRILVQTIERLPEKEKKVMQLYYYSELTYKEISEILKVSESRISQIHTKAVAKLRIALEELYLG